MGYYTRYTLKIVRGYADSELVERRLREVSDYSIFLGEETDGIKWYDNDINMERLSEEFPDVVFELRGIGEEHGDEWISYYCNGASHTFKAEIRFDYGKFTVDEFWSDHHDDYHVIEEHAPQYEVTDFQYGTAMHTLEALSTAGDDPRVNVLRDECRAVMDLYKKERKLT